MKYQPVPRQKQQLGGAFIFFIGIVGNIWIWHMAIYDGLIHRKASMIFPAFALIGLGLMLFPGYREERMTRGEDISKLSGLQLLTPRWWAILAISIAASLINIFAIFHFLK